MKNDPEIYNLIEGILKSFEEHQEFILLLHDKDNINPEFISFKDLQIAHFSDSIVISQELFENNPQLAVFMVIWLTRAIVGGLFEEGILVRGGIALNWAFHNKNIVFGQAIVDAYELECKVARVPRIVVQDTLVKMLLPEDKDSYLLQDSDGFWYLDLFQELTVYDPTRGISQFRRKPKFDSKKFRRVRKFISKGLEKATSPDLIVKYQWLANKYNDEISRYKGLIKVNPIKMD